MYDFAYHKPSSVADAVKLLAADPEAKPVSGGHTLLPALKHRLNKPSALVDLSGIAEMKGIKKQGNAIVIGVEWISPFMDWENRNVAVLFGDGCAAVVVVTTPSLPCLAGRPPPQPPRAPAPPGRRARCRARTRDENSMANGAPAAPAGISARVPSPSCR